MLSLRLPQKVEDLYCVLSTQLRILGVGDVDRVQLRLVEGLLQLLELLKAPSLRVYGGEVPLARSVAAIVGVDAGLGASLVD